MSEVDQSVPFTLGMFGVSGSPAFPVLVFDDNAAVALHAVLPLAGRIGETITGSDSIFGLLQNWDNNFAALGRLAQVLAFDDRAVGYRGAFTDAEFFQTHAPIGAPRQIFLVDPDRPHRITMKPPSSVCGPRDQIRLPSKGGRAMAGVALGIVIGRGLYRGSCEEAEHAIAGYMVLNDIVDAVAVERDDGLLASGGPRLFPAGPCLVPRQFAPPLDALDVRLSINGYVVHSAQDGPFAVDAARAVFEVAQRSLLLPGDVVGVRFDSARFASRNRPIDDGDVVEATVVSLGQLFNNCILER